MAQLYIEIYSQWEILIHTMNLITPVMLAIFFNVIKFAVFVVWMQNNEDMAVLVTTCSVFAIRGLKDLGGNYFFISTLLSMS